VGLAVASAADSEGHTVERYTAFDIEQVEGDQDVTFWSSDGLAELYLPAGALSAAGRVGIASAGQPGEAPEGLIVIGGPYAIQAAAGLSLTGRANLTLFYTAHGDLASRVRLFGAALYHWNGTAWEAMDSDFEVDHQYASAPIDDFGVYALMTSDAPILDIYLPVVLRN
jgi:hypothetical protein